MYKSPFPDSRTIEKYLRERYAKHVMGLGMQCQTICNLLLILTEPHTHRHSQTQTLPPGSVTDVLHVAIRCHQFYNTPDRNKDLVTDYAEQ